MTDQRRTSDHVSTLIGSLRRAFADYVASEGCSCCQNTEAHEKAARRIAKLLDVPSYSDGSGYDFLRFRSPRKRR